MKNFHDLFSLFMMDFLLYIFLGIPKMIMKMNDQILT